MPPHDSSDSWIDLSEIEKLVEQLMPSQKASESGPPPQLPPLRSDEAKGPSSLDDAPISLVPDIPLEWEKDQPDGLRSFPSLDDLEVPEKEKVVQEKSEPELIFKEKTDEVESSDEPAEVVEAAEEEPAEPFVEDDEPIVEGEDDIPPPKVISMQSKVRADETLAHIRRLGRSSLPEAEETEPFLKAEPEPEMEASPSEPEPAEPEVVESKIEEPVEHQAAPVADPEPVSEGSPETETPEAPEAPEASEGPDQTLFLPQGSLRIRLQAYGDWVHQVTECTRFQITDGQGYSLMEDENEQEASFVGSALQLMKVLETVGPKVGGEGASSGVYLPMGADQWLCVLGAETRYGPVCLSMVTRAPLSAAAADELTRTLKRTLEAVG